jgi:uncharacterized membrane protein YgdD (TMEM256/DUF423 family)
MDRIWIAVGALAGLGAVGMAAVAAHAPPALLADRGVQLVQSAVQIQAWHALALLFTGLFARLRGGFAHVAGGLFVVGMLLFCGAVYLLAMTGRSLGPVAPTGGVLLMLGWASLGIAALRR